MACPHTRGFLTSLVQEGDEPIWENGEKLGGIPMRSLAGRSAREDPKRFRLSSCTHPVDGLNCSYDVRQSLSFRTVRDTSDDGSKAMRELEKPVSRVFRRLRFQRFVTTLVWALAIAFLLVAVLLGSLKSLNLVMPGPEWAPFAV